MLLDFKEFEEAAKEVETIISLPEGSDLNTELINSAKKIPPGKKREFYRHMNSLFLNILLNRLDELGPSAERRSIEARSNIVNIINKLP